jgi:hypothetical protein
MSETDRADDGKALTGPWVVARLRSSPRVRSLSFRTMMMRL